MCYLTGSLARCQDHELSCKNEGYCEKLMGIPRCICKEGFFGETCHLNGGRNSSLGVVVLFLPLVMSYLEFQLDFRITHKSYDDLLMSW